jgi:hypothetical protein
MAAAPGPKPDMDKLAPINAAVLPYGAPAGSVFFCKTSYFQGKARQVEIALTPLGFALLERPVPQRAVVKLYASIIDVPQIDFAGPRSIVIHHGQELIDIECMEIGEVITRLTQVRALIMYDCGAQAEMIFQKFPPEQAPPQTPVLQIPANLPPMRYMAACAKYGDRPDIRTRTTFLRCEFTDRTIVSFDSQMTTPCHAGIVSFALERMPSLRVITFTGYAPTLIGRIIHKVLKRNKNVQVIYLGGYKDFRFELMNFARLEDPSVVSWNFSDLQFSDVRLCSLLAEIALYQGDIQQFEISRTKFTIQSARLLDQVLRVAQCFRSLEFLTVEEIDIAAGDALAAYTGIAHAEIGRAHV